MRKRIVSQQGLSIVELLIAVFLGLMMSAGLVQVLMSNKVTSRLQNELARLQENGRFAVDSLARDLRSADYWGCTGDKTRVTNHVTDTTSDAYFDIQNAITGEDGTDETTPDSLTLIGATLINEARLKPDTTGNTGTAVGFTANGYNTNGLVDKAIIIANCQQSDIFEVESVVGDTLVHNKALSGVYDDRAFFYSPYKVQYSISGNDLIRNLNGTDTLIASGVKNMQIYYGEDTSADGVANRFVSKTDVTDFNNVVAVKIHLLVSTPSENVAQAQQDNDFAKLLSYIKVDTTGTATTKHSDKALYYPFTLTIAVRNRVL